MMMMMMMVMMMMTMASVLIIDTSLARDEKENFDWFSKGFVFCWTFE